ncbi:hypothetical protein NP493_636g03000 [Ridgeia piscesae]|uniref:Macro domain-containing protein n=1 Tax=Ridgeia piscesae TaxID=27915 RepID=A0AAD9KSS7_RIDPI|nr:hypothetical protein NP493_636g03000 [Ridgeia piscesae]
MQNVQSTRPGQSGSATAAGRPDPEQTACRPIDQELYKLRMLHALRFKTEQEEKFPGLTVTIDTREGTVTFEGKEFEVTRAVAAMHDLVDHLESISLEMSAELIKLMRGITMMKHMVGVFKKNKIVAVYAAEGDTTLGVYACDRSNLQRAISKIRMGTCDEQCRDSAQAIETEEFTAMKEDLQSKYPGLLTITERGGHISLSGMVDPVADAKVPILQLVARTAAKSDDSTVLDSVQMGGCTVQVVRGDLTTFHAEAIVNAANERLEHGGGLGKAIVDAGTADVIIIHIYP